MKKILNAILFVLLFIWQLPQNILAILIKPFLGRLTKVRYDKCTFAYKCENMSGGISLGSFIFLSELSAKRNTIIAHEYGHCVDSKILGPLYLLVIGIPSGLNALLNITKNYYDFYTEKLANKHANLQVNDNGRLEFK